MNILNNDCIQTIFLKLKNPQDFLQVSQVCKRLQQNAEAWCFPFKHLYIQEEGEDGIDFCLSFGDARSIMIAFGPLIKSIHCELLYCVNTNRDEFIVNQIAKFCGKTLLELVLLASVRRVKVIQLRSSFQVLKYLELRSISITNLPLFFPQLTNLSMRVLYAKIE